MGLWTSEDELNDYILELEQDKKDLQLKLIDACVCAECLYCSNNSCKNKTVIASK